MNRQRLTRVGLTIVCIPIAAMWVYAFGFASRESVNKIGDKTWQANAQAICLDAQNYRFSLEDLSEMDPTDTQAMAKKADIVDKATDSLAEAIDKISKLTPSDEKGKAIVPDWLADYKVYIENRRQFAERLRTEDRRPYFSETEVEGVPISERIGKFARENNMKACQPPVDLSV